ncbi:MAG: DUF5605 domain-containing protein [Microbacteriaceae bacterium]|nr:DUF5605 domain-containing protein [Microbacteriaceae bacterium]
MTSDRRTFGPDTPLVELLRDAGAAGILRRTAPAVVGSTLLHTYHSRPAGLVLATEGSLTDRDRSEIFRELRELANAPQAAPVVRSPQGLPSRDYEPDGVARASAPVTSPAEVARWQRFEAVLSGPEHGNPFIDVELTGRFFAPSGAAHDVLGFYDGAGRYVVRLLPGEEGEWRFELTSNARSLDGVAGRFRVVGSDRRGPVRVADGFHFAYADGTRYLPFGTTSYVWTHQGDALEERTLETLADSPFNKMRMCVFPKSYTFNSNEPDSFPYLPVAGGGFDHERFDPAFWAHLERRIDQLAGLGVEADLILFHAYDRWGFSEMDAAADDRYVRYAVARLSSFVNLWWSLANEFDLLHAKAEADWERWAAIVQRWDATGHPRSIHNCRVVYDQSRPWITHVSMQRTDVYKTAELVGEWRERWGKPVVVDECAYEGDIDQGWGNISGEEMTRRVWEGTLRGGYVGHGETYLEPDEVLWWAKGGELHGTSPARIGFLRRIVEEAPGGALEPLDTEWDVPVAGIPGEYYLYYLGATQPAFRRFLHDPAIAWHVDVIDTWNMTVSSLPNPVSGRFVVELPSRPYQAVRLRRIGA